MISFGTRRSGTEYIHGTGDDNVLSGYWPGEESTDTSADHIYGYGGYDNLFGGRGDDYLYGGSDDDNLTGGAGADYLDGGTGNNNCAWYTASPAGVAIDLIWHSGHGGNARATRYIGYRT